MGEIHSITHTHSVTHHSGLEMETKLKRVLAPVATFSKGQYHQRTADDDKLLTAVEACQNTEQL